MPIAVIADDAESEAASRALRAGADVVLKRPTDLETLTLELERLVGGSASLRKHNQAVVAHARAEIDRARVLLGQRDVALSRIHRRLSTTSPPLRPPELNCTECGKPLKYDQSYLGGVSERFAEQWDYYRCEQCGMFQYRQRTKRLRRLDQTSS